jgi:hypothetical protein
MSLDSGRASTAAKTAQPLGSIPVACGTRSPRAPFGAETRFRAHPARFRTRRALFPTNRAAFFVEQTFFLTDRASFLARIPSFPASRAPFLTARAAFPAARALFRTGEIMCRPRQNVCQTRFAAFPIEKILFRTRLGAFSFKEIVFRTGPAAFPVEEILFRTQKSLCQPRSRRSTRRNQRSTSPHSPSVPQNRPRPFPHPSALSKRPPRRAKAIKPAKPRTCNVPPNIQLLNVPAPGRLKTQTRSAKAIARPPQVQFGVEHEKVHTPLIRRLRY